MSSLNKVTLIGHLGRAPETRSMPNGDMVSSLVLATTEKWKDKSSGEQKEHTEWHRITAFRKLADICAQYLDKGSLIYLEGKINTRQYTDKDGNQRYSTEIIAEKLQMLNTRSATATTSSSEAAASQPAKPTKPAAPARAAQPSHGGSAGYADFDDDIPFAPLPRKALLIL